MQNICGLMVNLLVYLPWVSHNILYLDINNFDRQNVTILQNMSVICILAYVSIFYIRPDNQRENSKHDTCQEPSLNDCFECLIFFAELNHITLIKTFP